MKVAFGNKKHNHGYVCVLIDKAFVQSAQRFNSKIKTFVLKLIPPGGNKIHGAIQVKRIRLKEMPHDKLMYFILIVCMKVLKFIERFKSLYIQTVGQHSLRLSFEQVLAL